MILWKPIASVGQESFACMKTKGFDIESTHLRHDDRLEKMFAIVSMAAAAALAASKNDNKIQTGKRKNPTRKKPRLRRQIRLPPWPEPFASVSLRPSQIAFQINAPGCRAVWSMSDKMIQNIEPSSLSFL